METGHVLPGVFAPPTGHYSRCGGRVEPHRGCCPCRSAHLVSRYRPRAPIIAITRNEQTARQAHLYRGIFPVLCKDPAQDAWAEDVDLRVNLGMNVGEWHCPPPLEYGPGGAWWS